MSRKQPRSFTVTTLRVFVATRYRSASCTPTPPLRPLQAATIMASVAHAGSATPTPTHPHCSSPSIPKETALATKHSGHDPSTVITSNSEDTDARVIRIRMKMSKTLLTAIMALALVGCASVSHPPKADNVDRSHDYVPHRDIGATSGTPENPDGGAGAIAGLLQLLFH